MKSFSHIYSSKVETRYFRPFSFLREKLGSENVSIDGRSLSQSVVVIDNPVERFKGLKGVDFCLENQLSAGVNLTPCKFNPSTLEVESSILRSLSNLKSQKVIENEN